ncbi:trehalose-phosphatase [Colletotrichum navitas]|uniref:Trehalose 6-phosphate phosphatase n=1 Tax=Colletotrichum navitas TaxID=681940 RepID=A0AAD8V3B9_9PEZI|nr:trehalose-phosphatase [Colletotrichum navitas]KAK1585713.1 trehalose-phosphatase [Colletotrichum navitas]
MCDYDGTLVPFDDDPERAVPPQELLEDLRTLAASRRNTVWLISGRDRTFLSRHFGSIEGLGLSAEHGAFVKNPRQEWVSLGEQYDMSVWKQGAREIMEKWTKRTPNTRVEEKQYSLSWHYRKARLSADSRLAEGLGDELQAAIKKYHWDMVVVQGDKVVEVKSRFLDKGQIVTDILQRSYQGRLHILNGGQQGKVDFVLNVGDDTSDEHMFKAVATFPGLGGAYTMWVQHKNKPDKKTEARWKTSPPAHRGMAWNAPPSLLHMFGVITSTSKEHSG